MFYFEKLNEQSKSRKVEKSVGGSWHKKITTILLKL